MEGRQDNRLRNRDIEYHVYFDDLPAAASGTRFFQTVLDPAVGSEVVLLLVDQTDFAQQLARRSPFELRLKTGAVQTRFGVLIFLLWWVPPVSDGLPFALYEHLLNPSARGSLEMVRRLAIQTHLHVLLIGPGQELLDCYEFENTFHCEAMLPIIEPASIGPTMDLEAAKREYEGMFDLRTLFQMEPAEGGDEAGPTSNPDSAIPEQPEQLSLGIVSDDAEETEPSQKEEVEQGDDGQYRTQCENALDWRAVERATSSAFDVWMGQPELAWARKAFDVLSAAGLLQDTDALSHQIAIFRVLCMGGIYRDFCDAAWDESSWIDYSEWCVPDEIADRFVIGQLFAKMPDWDEDEEVDFSVALDRLVEAEREIVVDALLKGFGGTPGLYASLWQSRVDPDDLDEELQDMDCFEPDEPGKLKAYEWVSDGCYRIADPAE